jgi:hypothetical protein
LRALNLMYQFEATPDLIMTSSDGYIMAQQTSIGAGVAVLQHVDHS